MTRAVEKRKIVIALGLAVGALFLALFARGAGPQTAQAASHREAPLISLDPTADITDFFMFRDYAPGQQDKVVLIMDVIPGEEPSSGPNYWNFDPNVLYKFSVDNGGDGNADDVSFSFDEGELMRLLDSEVEAHGLRQTALVVSVAVAAAAGGASAAAAAHGPTSGTVGSASSVAVAAAHDEATLAQRGIDVQPASAIHDEVGLAARGVAAPGTHDEASLASRGIAVQSASAIHDEAGLAARGVAVPGTHDEASLASRGIEVQPLPAVHDEAGLASRGIEAQPLTSAVHDEATLASRGIEVTPSPTDGGSSFALPSIDATTTGIAAGLAGGLLIITAAGFAVRRNRPIRPA